MKTLVIGGTGTVGSQVVEELVRHQVSVRVLVTSAEKAAQLPEGVEAVIGNLDQPGTLPKAFTGIDVVFLLNRQGHTEAAQGQYAIAAAKRAGVRKVVYQSIHNVRQGAHIPHFQPKITIENVLMQSGLSYVFICPNNFYQNDFWFTNAISTYGVYPQPIGDVGLNRVDVRDIAEAAVIAMLTDDYNGQHIPLVGPETLTGEVTASILSEQLDAAIYYRGNDLDVWATDARRSLPDWIISDWTKMYQFFQAQGLVASDQDIAFCTKVLGHAPRSYADFIADHLLAFHLHVEVA
ncbi:NAD-dependent epimerase/dehydratase family protein [Spirosoma sp. KCTC 42546]|uniref:SDR family oxidoreductase n=1 Tax=Spirosoma sp. KCTC 42546 TaxID=2520506 RepID=UPI00115818CD|nr:NmrA family NAD(P)-binding protein [Spirosoma sp. KCTC 42546]QDK80315.1 NAD-dependent epimerase/dehydratase family protein [Spirosoma sp. KCTC 42546]